MEWKNLFKKKKGVVEESPVEKEIRDFYDIGPIDETNAVYRMIIG